MKKMSIFYDANCFTIIPAEDLKAAIRGNDNFITTPVFAEIQKGYQNNPLDSCFLLALKLNGDLQDYMNEISLEECEREDDYKFLPARKMYLKKKPLLCSAYYTWIVSAINPAIVHDPYRHVFNEIAFKLKTNDGDISQLLSVESQLRVKETQLHEYIDKKTGRKRIVTLAWLLRARRKRIDEIKEKKTSLSDYQTLTTALLFCCMHGKTGFIFTADRDLVDIKDNLYKSIIERYAVYELLDAEIKAMTITQKKISEELGIRLELDMGKINNKVTEVIQKIHEEKNTFSLFVYLYRPDKNKVFPYSMKIPIWMRDIILEYKKNVGCMSLRSEFDYVYNIQYVMHPDFERNIVKHDVRIKQYIPDKPCIPFCYLYCKYPRIEKYQPDKLGEFI